MARNTSDEIEAYAKEMAWASLPDAHKKSILEVADAALTVHKNMMEVARLNSWVTPDTFGDPREPS